MRPWGETLPNGRRQTPRRLHARDRNLQVAPPGRSLKAAATTAAMVGRTKIDFGAPINHSGALKKPLKNAFE